uniref:FHA domain-containing protein n=2 Tax=Eutreptiella gymnastica TaxID=73025 RepID=A0A7S1NEB4_9EUGL|mmetsp:Transcript_22281/g.39994  ORF Transcript_22281/g.39994 Transcript_22281/m.39994 type:complete len:682 (+) Transcript_22281:129-2174(+)
MACQFGYISTEGLSSTYPIDKRIFVFGSSKHCDVFMQNDGHVKPHEAKIIVDKDCKIWLSRFGDNDDVRLMDNCSFEIGTQKFTYRETRVAQTPAHNASAKDLFTGATPTNILWEDDATTEDCYDEECPDTIDVKKALDFETTTNLGFNLLDEGMSGLGMSSPTTTLKRRTRKILSEPSLLGYYPPSPSLTKGRSPSRIHFDRLPFSNVTNQMATKCTQDAITKPVPKTEVFLGQGGQPNAGTPVAVRNKENQSDLFTSRSIVEIKPTPTVQPMNGVSRRVLSQQLSPKRNPLQHFSALQAARDAHKKTNVKGKDQHKELEARLESLSASHRQHSASLPVKRRVPCKKNPSISPSLGLTLDQCHLHSVTKHRGSVHPTNVHSSPTLNQVPSPLHELRACSPSRMDLSSVGCCACDSAALGCGPSDCQGPVLSSLAAAAPISPMRTRSGSPGAPCPRTNSPSPDQKPMAVAPQLQSSLESAGTAAQCIKLGRAKRDGKKGRMPPPPPPPPARSKPSGPTGGSKGSKPDVPKRSQSSSRMKELERPVKRRLIAASLEDMTPARHQLAVARKVVARRAAAAKKTETMDLEAERGMETNVETEECKVGRPKMTCSPAQAESEPVGSMTKGGAFSQEAVEHVIRTQRFSSLTCVQLLAICTSIGLPGMAKKRKAVMIETIKNHFKH